MAADVLTPEFRAAGDSALIMCFAGCPVEERSLCVRQALRWLDAERPAGIVDVVPTYTSVLIIYDPLRTSRADLEGRLSGVVRLDAPAVEPDSRDIPVLYGGDAGKDLADIAAEAGMSERDAVELHCSAEYTVHFLGFMPGFPYLGTVPEPLRTRRLQTPRTHVPAGSVAIADDRTGIYPVTSPGGWRLIGRTPYRLFDPRNDPPALLKPGDRVRFVPVDEAEYSHLHFQVVSADISPWPVED